MQTKGENQDSRGRPPYDRDMRFPVALPAPNTRSFDAVGFGLNTTDMLAVVPTHPLPGSKSPIERLEALPGGQAATAMTACSRLGWKARYVGKFGDDQNGTAGMDCLRADGVDVTAAKVVPGASNAVSLVLVDASTGQRTVMWSRHPGLKQRGPDVQAAAVTSGRILLVDCHDTEASTVAARYARKTATPTVVDVEYVRPGIDDLLEQIDFIITAQDFPTALTGVGEMGAALRAVFDRYRPALVCATLGEEGSLAVTSDGEVRTQGFTVPAVDTTGAGDCFRGGFIAGWLLQGRGADIEDVLRYANAVAALKCRALGARNGIPSRAEVEALITHS